MRKGKNNDRRNQINQIQSLFDIYNWYVVANNQRKISSWGTLFFTILVLARQQPVEILNSS